MSRERILAVAARLFAAGGFEATSMRDIAGPSGLLAGSIYHHFRSKNDLIQAVYRAGVAEIADALRALTPIRTAAGTAQADDAERVEQWLTDNEIDISAIIHRIRVTGSSE